MKYIWSAVATLVFTVFTIWFITLAMQQHPQLELAVKNAIAANETSVSLADFDDWTETYLFGPYTTREMIEEEIGRKFRGTSLASDDLSFLLVLVDTKNSIRYAVLPRIHRGNLITNFSLTNTGEIIIEYHR